MTDIARQRLHNQRLTHSLFQSPAEVVSWFGAVQAQEYALAKWGLAQRMSGSLTDADIEVAFNAGEILRTHILRPTWHFVTPEDIRWMLALTAPRVHAVNRYMYRKLELDDGLLLSCTAIIEKALSGGKHLTRSELGDILEQNRIVAARMRLGYIMHYAELEAVICSGVRRGKQFTYALVDEQAPNARILERDEALKELTLRFFQSHGPASIDDFAWWSGLTKADVRTGLEMVKDFIVEETIDGHRYWYPAETPDQIEPTSPTVFLLPTYDEYSIAYKKHSTTFIFNPAYAERLQQIEEVRGLVFNSVIVIDGQIVGLWRRTFGEGMVIIETVLCRLLTASEEQAYIAATERFGAFLDMPVESLPFE